MSTICTRKRNRLAAVLPAVALCFAGGLVSDWAAADSPGASLLFASETLRLVSEVDVADDTSLPIVVDRSAGLLFDVGGSETRKLQLELDQPLSLQGGMDTRLLDNGSDLLGLDATLRMPLTGQASLEAGIGRQHTNARFQPLGSIHCVNGTLRADSYTASGCRFINETFASAEARQFDLGARFDFSSASASVRWFTQQSEVSTPGVRQLNGLSGQPTLTESLLSPNLGNPLLSTTSADPLQYLNAEASGVDLNFKVGVATDNTGDVQLGLAFSRILEADYGGLWAHHGTDTFSWTLAEPFNSARMNVEWSKGSFSTGIEGYYRDSVDFLNRNSLDSFTTFDVHFTWRTPWNANLSVGASNVLNAGSDGTTTVENQPVDPLESIYGRIPYVRYKQDL